MREVCELIATANSSELRRHPVARLFWDALQRCPSPKGPGEWTVWEGEDLRLLQLDSATARVPVLDSFLELLHGLNAPSMEAFLAHDFGPRNTLFSYLGRLAVATVIANRERVTALNQAFEQGKSQDWYGVLWESLVTSALEKGQRLPAGLPENIKIISCNLDRSLEFFLARGLGALQLLRSKQTPRLADMLTLGRDAASQSVLHLNGSLGPITHVPFGLPLEAQPDPGRLCEMALNLKNWGLEGASAQEKTFAKARSWIEASERVVFVGMDFNTQLLKSLGFSPSSLDDEIDCPAPLPHDPSSSPLPPSKLRWSELTSSVGWVKGTVAYFKQAAPSMLTGLGGLTGSPALPPKALYATTADMSTGEILRWVEHLGMWTSSAGRVCRTYVPTEVTASGASTSCPVIRQRGDATDAISHHLYAYRLLPGL
jgi:hypothetical protein